MSNLQIEQFTARTDNFGVLIHDPEANLTASIDAPEEQPILAALKRRGWNLTHIFTTHHHGDHVEANLALKKRFGVQIIGPQDERSQIPGIDRAVSHGERFQFGNFSVDVISTPGSHRWRNLVSYSCGKGRLYRRYPVFAWLRPYLRGNASDDVQIAATAPCPAGGY